MFVVSRKIGESIIIEDNICFKLLKTTDNRALIGIIAPREVRISRDEVYKALVGEVNFKKMFE